MTHSDDDVKTWIAEWRLWGGVSFVLALVWVVWSIFRGSFDMYWPLGVIVVWAVVLLLAPLWPSNRRHDPSTRSVRDQDRDA